MKFRGVAICVTIVLMVSVFVSCGNTKAIDDSLDKVKEKGVFVVGIYKENEPMSYIDDHKNYTGFDVELATKVSEEMDVEITFKAFKAAEELKDALHKGTIDAIWSGYSINEKDLETLDFSKPYLYNRQILMVSPYSKIMNFKALTNKVLGVLNNSMAQNILDIDKDLSERIKTIKTFNELAFMVENLENNKLNAILGDAVDLLNYNQKYNTQFVFIDNNVGADYIAVAFRKEDVALQTHIDLVLDNLNQNGFLRELSEKYFKINISTREVQKITEDEVDTVISEGGVNE